MQESKHTTSTNHIKRKDISYTTPFDSYNSLTKERNVGGHSYLTSSRKKSNRSLLDQEIKSGGSHLCLEHCLSVKAVCFSCEFALCCPQCLKQLHSSSQEHDIRSIQKSTLFIKNSLIHSQIKLQAKCNILTNINQQLNNQKIQLFNSKNQYRQQLQRTFEYLHQLLKMKQKQMSQEIEEVYLQHQKNFVQTVEEIKHLQAYYDKCQQSIGSVLDMNAQCSLGDFSLCLFYSQKHQILEDIVKETELNQLKKQIYDLKYKIENGSINSIIKSLNQINIGYDIKFTYIDIQQTTQSRNNSLKKAISKVKSQTQLKLKPSKKKLKKPIRYLDIENTEKVIYPETRYEKQRQSHKINGTFCTSTPKQGISREKKFDLMKRSPQATFLLKKRKKSTAKMISMPASPAKEDKQQRISPINKVRDFIIEGMKKKTTILKKKK